MTPGGGDFWLKDHSEKLTPIVQAGDLAAEPTPVVQSADLAAGPYSKLAQST